MNSMTLIGLNHRTADVAIRERFDLSHACTPDTWAIPARGVLRESWLLSTCNRVEALGIGPEGDTADALAAAWAGACGCAVEELRPHLYTLRQEDAVRHIFAVASGLDSLVLGEPQILGQMKAAYRNAVEAGSAGTLINRLLHKAFFVAKRVRTETGVSSSAVSISYAAVELAKRIFEHMHECRALLVGAGEMAELAATHLMQCGVRQLTVVNRTLSNAEQLAARFDATADSLDRLSERLVEADIIISSTGASEPIIMAEHLHPVLRKRRQRPMFFIDIAVPRDIDPRINDLDNVYLYDIDDLKDTVADNMRRRECEADKAHGIVDAECAAFIQWYHSLKLQPTIVDLIRRHETYAREELARTVKRLGRKADPETVEALTAMLDALVRKIDHDPLLFLKSGRHQSEEARTRAIDVTRRMFGLDKAPGRTVPRS